MRSAFIAAIIILGLTACSATTSPELTSPAGPARSAGVIVNNGHAADIKVFADDGHGRIPLGTVSMFGSRTFVLPRVIALPSELRLCVVARIDGQEFTSPAFLARYGDFFVLNVENSTVYSTLLKR
jgi:hypothetical protein